VRGGRDLPDGSFKRLGPKGGAPNGINMDREGRVLIANFGIYDKQEGPLQRFDPATGQHETLVAQVGGKRLTSANYPVMDRAGNIWCANSTHAETWPQALDGRTDGFIFVLRPDGSTEIVAEGLKFPNGMALSADEATSSAPRPAAPTSWPSRCWRAESWAPATAMARCWASCSRRSRRRRGASDLGYTDGVGMDAEGNLWVCLPAANKVVAITSSLEVVTVIHDLSGEIVNHPTNITWGGPDLKDLYIGSIRAGYVLKGRSPVAGPAAYPPVKIPPLAGRIRAMGTSTVIGDH
jgi:gluconolactonase